MPAANPAVGRLPNRIEHFTLASSAAVRRAAALGVAVAVQPSFMSLAASMIASRPPSVHFLHLREFLDAGLVVAGSSDGPMIPNPFLGMQAACTRRTLEGEIVPPLAQCISPSEAFSLYTEGGAKAGGICADEGTLAWGKRANFILLERDFLREDPATWSDVRVTAAFVDGRQAWPASERPLVIR